MSVDVGAQSSDADAPSSVPVPVLIITGYAGAGKTVLTNLLLQRAKTAKLNVAVIVHRQAEEYGIATNPIDDAPLPFCETVYDFGSGCICCSPKGELIRLLSEAHHKAAG